MSSGFLGSFSGALEGVTEAEAEEFRAQKDARNSVDEVSNPAPEAEEPGEATEAAANPEGMRAARPPCTPEICTAADEFLAGTIYEQDRETPVDIFEEADVDVPRLWLHSESGSVEVVDGEPVLIGRIDPQTGVAFLTADEDTVSREHCSVRLFDGAVLCADLGSTNGTWVLRGDEVIEVADEVVRLQSGDTLTTKYDRVVLAELRERGEQE